jgi:hypothetical protein
MRPLGILLLALLAVRIGSAQGRPVVGIMPVYDDSAENLTEALPLNMTYLIYERMRTHSSVQPVLLSPGGLYDPESLDWARQYGRKAHVDVVLISKLLPTARISDRKRRLNFEVKWLDVASGKLSEPQTNSSIDVSTSDLLTDMASGYSLFGTYKGLFPNSEEFLKVPLGKAALKLSDWIELQVGPTLTSLGTVATGGPEPKPQTCEFSFSVRYAARHSTSKSLSVLVDDKDETSTLKEGHATFPMQSGPMSFRVQVNDAPYGMPAEKQYQISTTANCEASRTAVLELGTAGEGFIKWE